METTRIASIHVRGLGNTHKRTQVFQRLKNSKKHTQQRLQQTVGKMNDLENVSLVEQVEKVKVLLYLSTVIDGRIISLTISVNNNTKTLLNI